MKTENNASWDYSLSRETALQAARRLVKLLETQPATPVHYGHVGSVKEALTHIAEANRQMEAVIAR